MRINLGDAASLANLTAAKQQDIEALLRAVVQTDADKDAEKIPDRILMLKILEAQAVLLVGMASVHFFRAEAQAKARAASGIQVVNGVPILGRG